MSGALKTTRPIQTHTRAYFLRKHLEENESTEDPDMDKTALENESDKKAVRKNVLVTDALKGEIR
jgi:hypothetical protein